MGVLVTVIIIAIGIRYVFFWKPINTKEIFDSTPIIIAHRGTLTDIPENTLESFSTAIANGFKAIEVDVCSTRDKTVICSHNIDLERETDGQGFIDEINYQEVKQAKAGIYSHPKQTKEILTLYDLLKEIPQGILVNIEIKTTSPWSVGTALGVVRLIKARRITQTVIISSFNPIVLWLIKLLAPNIVTGYLFKTTQHLWAIHFFHPDCLHPEAGIVTQELVNRSHDLGQRVSVWTVNSLPGKRWLKKLNVDGIITNYYSEN